ncbi:hypothetical protein HB961_04175 [Listeria welshimeri]|nr:hypothetical protein [Listeria welshimeri]MBC1685008.1 hypothetical protein [Listeria welshimeri]MBC1859802.1 hypothetical protein [Listeria welshimeri]
MEYLDIKIRVRIDKQINMHNIIKKLNPYFKIISKESEIDLQIDIINSNNKNRYFKGVHLLYYKEFLNEIDIKRLIINSVCKFLNDNYVNFIHSSAIQIYEGFGVAFVGKSNSGKTTTMLKMLKNMDSSYISNDKLCIRENKGITEIAGIPTGVNIRVNNIKEKIEYEDFFNSYISKRVSVTAELKFIFFMEYCDYNIEDRMIKIKRRDALELLNESIVSPEYNSIDSFQIFDFDLIMSKDISFYNYYIGSNSDLEVLVNFLKIKRGGK